MKCRKFRAEVISVLTICVIIVAFVLGLHCNIKNYPTNESVKFMEDNKTPPCSDTNLINLPYHMLYSTTNYRGTNDLPVRGIICYSYSEYKTFLSEYALENTNISNLDVDFNKYALFYFSEMTPGINACTQIQSLTANSSGRIFLTHQADPESCNITCAEDICTSQVFVLGIPKEFISEQMRRMYPIHSYTIDDSSIQMIYEAIESSYASNTNEQILYMQYSKDQSTKMLHLNYDLTDETISAENYAAILVISKMGTQESCFKAYWYYFKKDSTQKWEEASCSLWWI